MTRDLHWDGSEPPDGAALLQLARQTLLDQVVPHLTDDLRFKALMVASAMAVAGRDTPAARRGLAGQVEALCDLVEDDAWGVCAQIRTGTHDPGTETHDTMAAALTALAEDRCRISAPKALDRRR
jgi:hypothetical protein